MLGFGNKEKSKGVDYVEQKYGVKPLDCSCTGCDMLFSVYDVVQNCYMPPFISPTLAGAKRAMSEVASDPKALLNKYSDDYVLYQVGLFDKYTGVITGVPNNTPAKVCVLSELIKKGE